MHCVWFETRRLLLLRYQVAVYPDGIFYWEKTNSHIGHLVRYVANMHICVMSTHLFISRLTEKTYEDKKKKNLLKTT